GSRMSYTTQTKNYTIWKLVHYITSSRSYFTVLAALFPIIQLRPSSALFPYTTLFRSRQLLHDPPALGRLHRRRAAHHTAGAVAGDRKSTRLNSSHVKNSYAVFRSKKKSYGLIYEMHTAGIYVRLPNYGEIGIAAATST